MAEDESDDDSAEVGEIEEDALLHDSYNL